MKQKENKLYEDYLLSRIVDFSLYMRTQWYWYSNTYELVSIHLALPLLIPKPHWSTSLRKRRFVALNPACPPHQRLRQPPAAYFTFPATPHINRFPDAITIYRLDPDSRVALSPTLSNGRGLSTGFGWRPLLPNIGNWPSAISRERSSTEWYETFSIWQRQLAFMVIRPSNRRGVSSPFSLRSWPPWIALIPSWPSGSAQKFTTQAWLQLDCYPGHFSLPRRKAATISVHGLGPRFPYVPSLLEVFQRLFSPASFTWSSQLNSQNFFLQISSQKTLENLPPKVHNNITASW